MGPAASARELTCALPPRGAGGLSACGLPVATSCQRVGCPRARKLAACGYPEKQCAGEPIAAECRLEDGKKKRRVRISPELQDFSVCQGGCQGEFFCVINSHCGGQRGCYNRT
jgi:hypothetical protein